MLTFVSFLLYEVKPAVNSQQSRVPAGNSSRFRQLVKSYWHSIVISDASTSLSDTGRELFVTAPKVGEEYQLDPSLTNDIVTFICNNEITDVEAVRRAINCQVKPLYLIRFLIFQRKIHYTDRCGEPIFV